MDYVKGLLISLGGVALYYAALRFLMLDTVPGKLFLYLWASVFSRNAVPVAGGHPSVFMHLWFWLWAMIIFAGTFLIYLRVASGR